MPATLPSAVYDAWLRSRGVSAVGAVSGGLSGAEVYCAAGDGERRWAVRRWPPTVAGERVAEVHRAMRLARHNGCRWTPRVEPVDVPVLGPAGIAEEEAIVGGEAIVGNPFSWIILDGRVWDCCQWMVGRPPEANDDLVDMLRQTAVAIAQFHAAVRSLGPTVARGAHGSLTGSQLEHSGLISGQVSGQLFGGAVPAIRSRLQRLAELETLLEPWFTPGTGVNRGVVGATASQRALDCLRQVWAVQRQRAVRLLEPWSRSTSGVGLRQQIVFRDIHLENTLFHEGRLSGIVDYDALRIDSPATDLARLIGSLRLLLSPEEWGRSEERLWSVMLEAYRSRGEFSAEEARLAQVLAEVSPLIILANWVVWVVVERRSFPGPASRVDERMEGWTRIMRDQFAGVLRNSAGFETR